MDPLEVPLPRGSKVKCLAAFDVAIIADTIGTLFLSTHIFQIVELRITLPQYAYVFRSPRTILDPHSPLHSPLRLPPTSDKVEVRLNHCNLQRDLVATE